MVVQGVRTKPSALQSSVQLCSDFGIWVTAVDQLDLMYTDGEELIAFNFEG